MPLMMDGRTMEGVEVAEVADFVVVDRNRQESAPGKWRSRNFATGARNILNADGKELHNAYITLTLRIPGGQPGGHLLIRIIVNDNPLPELVDGIADTMPTVMAAFPASFLKSGGGNIVELHSQGEAGFSVVHAVVHFRQNS
jgi:hypothetical protein